MFFTAILRVKYETYCIFISQLEYRYLCVLAISISYRTVPSAIMNNVFRVSHILPTYFTIPEVNEITIYFEKEVK